MTPPNFTVMECFWYSLTMLFVGYCWGRAAEIGARIKERQRHFKAYGKYPEQS